MADDNPQQDEAIESAIRGAEQERTSWEPEPTGSMLFDELGGAGDDAYDDLAEYDEQPESILGDISPSAEDAAEVEALFDGLYNEFPSINTQAAQKAMTPILEQLIARGYDLEDLAQPDVLAMVYQRAGGEQKFASIAHEQSQRDAIVNSGPPKSIFTD